MNRASWPQVRLGDVLAKTSDWINLDPDTDYRQVTVRMWGAGVALRRLVKGSGIAASSQIRVRSGQFIVSKIDARHGAFGIVPDDRDGAIVSQDFPVFDTNEKRPLPEFLGWMSKTDWFVTLCRNSSEGSTNRVRLREDRFLGHTIPLPPLADQRRITGALDAVGSRIAARTQEALAVETDLAATLITQFQRIVAAVRRVPMGDVAPLVRRLVGAEPPLWSGRIEARIGLRMMPTFPRSPLSFAE
jgi:type I restriction enzyme, S subunit